jgi:predicted nucleic acid-binding protein
MRYFDARALANRYVRETGSVRVRRLLSSETAATSRLSHVEIASALIQRSREGLLAEAKRESALVMLNGDLAAMLVVELTPQIVARSQALLQRHSLRAGDAVQLASCLQLRDELQEPITLVAFDDRLAVAARRERIEVA